MVKLILNVTELLGIIDAAEYYIKAAVHLRVRKYYLGIKKKSFSLPREVA